MKTTTPAIKPQHTQMSVCARMHSWAVPAAVSLDVAKLFTTKINRTWASGGLLRDEVS